MKTRRSVVVMTQFHKTWSSADGQASHSCVWHAPFTCMTCHSHIFHMTCSFMWYDLFICVASDIPHPPASLMLCVLRALYDVSSLWSVCYRMCLIHRQVSFCVCVSLSLPLNHAHTDINTVSVSLFNWWVPWARKEWVNASCHAYKWVMSIYSTHTKLPSPCLTNTDVQKCKHKYHAHPEAMPASGGKAMVIIFFTAYVFWV